MWNYVQETERTSQYRFWFDVREPGAAAYAGQVGANALYFVMLIGPGLLPGPVGYWAMIPWFFAMLWLMGAVRRLNVWASLAVGLAVFGPLLSLFCFGVWNHWFFAVASAFLLAVVFGSGLPIAIWAAWVHRKLTREQRWELVGLRPVPANTPRWKRWMAEWFGFARPQPLFTRSQAG